MMQAGVRLSLPQTSPAAAAVVAQSFHAGDTDAEIHKPVAPGASKCISDENRNRKRGSLFDFAMEFACRTVGVNGQEKRVTPAIDIRDIDAAVRTDKPVMSFGDEHSILASNNGVAFP